MSQFIHYSGVCLSETATDTLKELGGIFESAVELETHLQSVGADMVEYVKHDADFEAEARAYALAAAEAWEKTFGMSHNDEYVRLINLVASIESAAILDA